MARLERNRRYLRELYEGTGPRLGLVYNPPGGPRKTLGDYSASERPVAEWVDYFEHRYLWRLGFLDTVHDDSVPYVSLLTNTGFFPAAFGADLHHYEVDGVAARPLITSAHEVASLSVPSLNVGPLDRFFELAGLLVDRLGPDVPISVPDIQSPFGIAAIIWDKADFLVACALEPDAVMDLCAMCHDLLRAFLKEFKRVVPSANMCHCPDMWVPPEYGCHLSEDEIGSISPEMFERFCLPWLSALSTEFGGLWIHCCADADHQYDGLAKIPGLRGLNRRFWRGAKPCIERFSDQVLFSFGCDSAEVWDEVIGCALPQTRMLFSVYGEPDEANRCIDELRERAG